MLPAAFSFAPFLAQAGTDLTAFSAQNPLFAYAVGAVVIGGIVTLVTVLDKIDAIWQRRKRTPSVDVDLGSLKTSIDALTATVDELKSAKDDHSGHKERIKALEDKCAALDAQLDREIATQRSYIAKTHKDISDQIEGVRTSFANNIQSVERGLGRVEGTLQALLAAKTS
jgi:uncharacterized phage infection (PIP) family protein YhgE